MLLNDLRRGLSFTKERIIALSERVEKLSSVEGELARECLNEVATSIEELTAAHDELAAQNTELAVTQADLFEEKNRFRDLFEWAPVSYVVTDVHGVIGDANKSAEKLFNVPKQHMLQKP